MGGGGYDGWWRWGRRVEAVSLTGGPQLGLAPQWSTLIGPDIRAAVLSLVQIIEPYYAGAKVYAITMVMLWHDKSGFHAQKIYIYTLMP